MDQDDYVQIVGRIKDLIIRSGENIFRNRETQRFVVIN